MDLRSQGVSAWDSSVPGYELTCPWCMTTFAICRRDYHGQRYCGDVCRKRAAAASHRLASARYERSLGDERKRDRRELRLVRAAKNAEAAALTDGRSQKVALQAESPASTAAQKTPRTVDEESQFDGRVQSGAVTDSQVDRAPGEPRSGRMVSGDSAVTGAGSARARSADAPGEVVVVARHRARCCVVCGRPVGRFLPRPTTPRPAHSTGR